MIGMAGYGVKNLFNLQDSVRKRVKTVLKSGRPGLSDSNVLPRILPFPTVTEYAEYESSVISGRIYQ